MRVIKELELFLHEEINKDILIFNRKKSDVYFIAHKYIKVDKKHDAYYVTCISKDIISKFKKLDISFNDIIGASKVIFYVVCNINSKESISINKLSPIEVEVTDVMCSKDKFETRIVQDEVEEIVSVKSYFDGDSDLDINDKFDYYINMCDDSDDKLLHDDLIYCESEEVDDSEDEIIENDLDDMDEINIDESIVDDTL